MIAAAAIHKFVTLTHMSRLTDWCLPLFFFFFFFFFEAKVLVLMDTFETRDLILGQIAYTSKCSSGNASVRPPVSVTFIHGPVILPYISNTV